MGDKICVGLDAHTDFTVAGYFDCGSGKVLFSTKLETKALAIKKSMERFIAKNNLTDGETEFVFGYEAGGLGYSLQRDMEALGLNCVIMAPTTIYGQGSRRKVKNDKKDAETIARALAFNQYSEIHVPDRDDEEAKELCRQRSFFVRQQTKFKQATIALLHRHGFHYQRAYWTIAHRDWMRRLDLSEGVRSVLDEYLAEIDRLGEAVSCFDSRIEELARDPKYRDRVGKLCCLRGISLNTAMVVITEVVDFDRFPTASHFAAFLGLMPGESSSSTKHVNTGLTKQGSVRVRTVLTESAQSYLKGAPGYKSKQLQKRQEGVDRKTVAFADKATMRLQKKARKMLGRGKNGNKVKAAVSRELACFIWALMTNHYE